MTRDDKRRHHRVTVNQEFQSIDAFLTEYVSDISEGGIFIRSKTPLPIGTKVELRFSILLEEVETIKGLGEVVRVTGEPIQGMGVTFTELTPSSRSLIQRMLDAREARLKVEMDDNGEGEVLELTQDQAIE